MKVNREEDGYVHWIEHSVLCMNRVFSRLPGLFGKRQDAPQADAPRTVAPWAFAPHGHLLSNCF